MAWEKYSAKKDENHNEIADVFRALTIDDLPCDLKTNDMETQRQIKFRAWIPDLGIMLENITLYGDGTMGYDEDEFNDALPEGHHIDHDYGAVVRRYKNIDGNEEVNTVVSILSGEDWVWVEDGNFAPMQYTGLKDRNGKEIYEGDLFKIGVEKPLFEVRFEHGCFMAFIGGGQWGLVADLQVCFIDVIGNIHENPELLK